MRRGDGSLGFDWYYLDDISKIMLTREKATGRSSDRPVFFVIVISACVWLTMSACEMQSERIAPFHGQITNLPDSNAISGRIIYDADSDGIFSDTAYFDTDDLGNFDGMLFYSTSATIRAPRLRKPVRILAPELGVDTFLDIDVYLKSHDFQIDPTEFGLIFCASPVADSSEIDPDSTEVENSSKK